MSHVPAARRAADEAGSGVIEVYCPVPLVVHPAGAGAVDAFAVDWLVDRGLFDRSSRIARTNLGWLITAAMPFTSEEFVKAFTAYSYWAFAWDDHLDRLAEDPAGLMAHVGEVVHALTAPSGTPADDNPWANGARAVRDLLFDCLPPEARTDFLHANTHWITGELWKRAVQLRDRPPDLGEYLRMRWAKLAGPVLATATGAGGGYPMGARHLREPLILAFSQAVLVGCAFFNDMAGSMKEAPTQSHVNVMAALAGDDPADGTGLARAYQLCERTLCLVPHLRRRLLADPRPEVARYAAELPQWIPATLHFTATSARYHHRAAPTLVTRDTPVSWDPTDLTPPAHPQISWWWDQLG